MPVDTLATNCCIVGGGPAGMMLGYLLARAGVAVIVLEKHKDFLRGFRGDTVHPSTLEVMCELGLLDDFLKQPHQKLKSTGGMFGDFPFQAADFTRLPTQCKFVALMPQWDFLNFLSRHGSSFQGFDLRMEHEAVGLIRENGRVAGVEVRTPAGSAEIRAHLVVGCDGRHSAIRRAAQFEILEFGVPIDVLWFRISRTSAEQGQKGPGAERTAAGTVGLPGLAASGRAVGAANDPEQLLGNFNYGQALILIPRGDYFQTGLLIRKNSFEQLKRAGLNSFRDRILRIAPALGDRVNELQDWKQMSLLSVQINRLRQWHRPGLLCIGDAAHAMSPAGGVGINLAIQDAVAAANLLSRPLKDNTVTESLLAQVQKRREFPTRVTQFMQMKAHGAMDRFFQNDGPIKAPWQLKAALQIPGLRHAIGRVVGMGVRPEHVAGARMRSGRICQNRSGLGKWFAGRKMLLGGLAFWAGVLVGAAAVNQKRKRQSAE